MLASSAPWMQRVGALAELPPLLRQLGADPAQLLSSVGLAATALDRAEALLPFGAVVRLLHEAARRTACGHFGLLAGRMWHLADLGVVGEICRNAETVGEALRLLTVHQHLGNGGGLLFTIRRGGHVDFGYAIYQPGLSDTAQMYDAVLAAALNILRELCGPAFAPTEVLLAHDKPADASHYRNLFKVQPQFNSELYALRFPEAWLEQRVDGADPARRDAALREAERAGRGTVVHQVYRALRLLLLQGRTSGDEVAQMLSMHRRTLNRRLKDEGTTFQAILDEVRFEVARELLNSSEIALDDIAAALGYAGVSPFMRTFRRWAGTTPGRWRRGTESPQWIARARFLTADVARRHVN